MTKEQEMIRFILQEANNAYNDDYCIWHKETCQQTEDPIACEFMLQKLVDKGCLEKKGRARYEITTLGQNVLAELISIEAAEVLADILKA